MRKYFLQHHKGWSICVYGFLSSNCGMKKTIHPPKNEETEKIRTEKWTIPNSVVEIMVHTCEPVRITGFPRFSNINDSADAV